MRAIYCVTGIPEWIDAARLLLEQHDWEPIYWFTTPAIHEDVRQAFPNAVVHRWHDAVRGVAAPGFEDCQRYPLDAEILGAFLPCQSTVLRMMDRMDPDFSFHFGERTRHYHRILMYWLRIVERLVPDIVVFSSSPHLVSDYVLYHVCTFRGIRTLICTQTSLPHTAFVRNSIDELPSGLVEAYATARRERLDAQDLGPEIEESLAALKGDYDQAEPAYMRRQRRAEHRAGSTTHRAPLPRRVIGAMGRPHMWPRYGLRLMERAGLRRRPARAAPPKPPPPNYFKPSGVPPEVRALNPEELAQHNENARRRRQLLRAHYESLAKPVDLGAPFIYVPLHYQPERSSCPEAGVFVDQYVLVNLIASCRPEGWHVYVREHPSQFRMMGEKGRTKDLYDDLSAIPGVSLVSLDESPFDLIDRSRAVGTATGTAGWEALVRGKPVFVFGNAWYAACEGAFVIRSWDDIQSAMEAAVEGHHADDAQIRAYAHAIRQVGWKLDVGGLGKDADEAAVRQHGLTISKALAEAARG